MKVMDVLTQSDIETLLYHSNFKGEFQPDYLQDCLLWHGKDLTVTEFALLCIASELETLRVHFCD